MRARYLFVCAAALSILACLERQYENPYLADGAGIEEGWDLDRNGNGISDSVEYYARDCTATPRECLRIALDSAAIAREKSALVQAGGDGSTVKQPQDSAIVVRSKDSVIVVQRKDTVVVQKKDTVVVQRMDTILVQKKDTVLVVQKKDSVVVVQKQDTVVVQKKDTVVVQRMDTVLVQKKDTVVVQKKDTVVVVPPKDTVIVVKPKDTVIAVTGIQAAAVYLPLGVAKVTPAVTVLPRDAKNRGYTLTSLNEAIVKVSGSDLVPVKAGTAKVRARTLEGGFTTEFDATVVLPDTNVYEEKVAVAPMEFIEGDAARAPAVTWTPANVTNQGYSLASGNPAVVQVVVEGSAAHCRPLSPGQATVTLTTRGKGLTATFKVTVKPAPIVVVKVLSMTAEDMVLEKGATGALPKVTLLPVGATDKSYVLASDNPKIVSVSGNRLDAVSGGRARVTATSPDGPSAVFQVTVRVPVVSVSSPDLVLEAGATAVPIVAFQPPDADDKAYTLASSNAKIVSVDGDAITAVKKGGADITITTADGAKTFLFKVKVEEAEESEEAEEAGKAGEDSVGKAQDRPPVVPIDLP